MSDSNVKRRRIIVEDDDEYDNEEPERRVIGDNESVGSNPDELLNDQPDSDDEEGEDLGENWMADYAPAPELDFYENNLLADEDEVQETYEQQMMYRRAAEEELEAEDTRRRQMADEYEDRVEEMNEREEAEYREFEEDDDEDEVYDDGERSLNLEAFDCPLREWIVEERTRREIHRRFRKFLLTYYVGIDEVAKYDSETAQDPDQPAPKVRKQPPLYRSKIRAMCAVNKGSMEVSYGHIGEMQPLLAFWLTDVPREMLQIFDEVLMQVVLDDFPHYNRIVHEMHVRIINLPLADRLRDLRQGDLNNLIRVTGVVTRRTGVSPQAKSVAYNCAGCNHLMGPFRIIGGAEPRPKVCGNCQETGPFVTNQLKSEFGNYQRLTLQESPGSVPAGRVPRYKDVILLGDLIDCARPGEEIEVTGIYSHSRIDVSKEKSGFPVFATVIEANFVQKKNSASNSGLSDEDKRKIRELSNDPRIRERIIHSIAPSIYGQTHVKTAVALSLFGGCMKEGGAGGTHRVRGDINVLLLGDPGTAKSQVLKYAEKIAPRSVYTTGKGASAVGLTAGVRRDHTTKEWTLEGGALVLADQGVCLIDEFDKMNEQDRTSIHEAMEQQTISVSKAGIVTSLQARCAVMAAANPIGGRYDPSYTLAENVELTDPILQRFDILCVLQDVVDPVADEQLALFVVDSHVRSHPNREAFQDDADGVGAIEDENPYSSSDVAPLDQVLFKKYIMYARTYVKPILHEVDVEKIASLYSELRQQSAISGGVPIAVRHIESVMRIAEASARMHLRDHVREDDIDMAIKVTLDSFSQAQKNSVRKSLQKCFRKYIVFGEEVNELLMHQLQELVLREEKYNTIRKRNLSDTTEVQMQELENKAKELNIFDLRQFYSSSLFRDRGFHIDERHQVIVKAY